MSALASAWRSWSVWICAGFIGLMFATAVKGPIPAVADWPSAIICSSGTSLTDHQYATQVPAQTQADGSTSSPATGVGYTYLTDCPFSPETATAESEPG